MATTQHSEEPKLEEDGFYSHDGSHLRTETPERTSFPESITLDGSALEQSEISVQNILHGEYEKYEAEISGYNVQVTPSTNGAYLRASDGEAVYRSQMDYLPANKTEFQEMIDGEKINRVF